MSQSNDQRFAHAIRSFTSPQAMQLDGVEMKTRLLSRYYALDDLYISSLQCGCAL